MVESRRRDPSGDGEVQAGWPRKFKKKLELWKCDFLRFGHQILVAVLGTLQDLVTLWSTSAVRNWICGDYYFSPFQKTPFDLYL